MLLLLLLFAAPAPVASQCGNMRTCIDCNSQNSSSQAQTCSWCSSSSGCVPSSSSECAAANKITNGNDCPVRIRSGYGYDETLAKKMLLISFSAYGNNTQLCLNTDFSTKDVTVTKQIVAPCDESSPDTCSGYTAVSQKEKAIIISFRGTTNQKQLMLEAKSAMTRARTSVAGGGTVCKYFYDAYASVWNGGMSEELIRLKGLYPDYDLWVTGHSMGAALATVAADVIAATNIFPGERMKVITYGEPRVGDEDFANAHDDLLPYKYRVTHRGDIVTQLPPKDLLGYRHHRYEVWYNNNMSDGDGHVVCLSPEDNSCSNRVKIGLTWTDHTSYFGRNLLSYMGNGCQSMH